MNPWANTNEASNNLRRRAQEDAHLSCMESLTELIQDAKRYRYLMETSRMPDGKLKVQLEGFTREELELWVDNKLKEREHDGRKPK